MADVIFDRKHIVRDPHIITVALVHGSTGPHYSVKWERGPGVTLVETSALTREAAYAALWAAVFDMADRLCELERAEARRIVNGGT